MKRAIHGFSLLELAVAAVVLGILFGVFLERLTFYRELVERARFEATLRLYKTALQIRLAELMLERRENEARTLEVENPTQWLSGNPADYAGEYPADPQAGNWYFDSQMHELVYVVLTGNRLTVAERNGLKQLRFHPRILYRTVAFAGGQAQAITGVALIPAQDYQWP